MTTTGDRPADESQTWDLSTPVDTAVEKRGTALPLLFAIALVGVVALGPTYGFVRAAIGVAMFFAIATFGTRQVRSMMKAPPEPEVVDVSDYGLKYVCTMCGLELKLEVAAKDRAPSHCMEPMVLERTGGRPPLKPVD
jgi:hypothetical protein